jgi:hypothetical protein
LVCENGSAKSRAGILGGHSLLRRRCGLSEKTETMLVDAARESGNPNLRAIIFRQQFTQMTDIVDKTHKLYKAMGATYVGQPSWTWTFPSGAKIRLAYISTDKDIWESLGPRYSFIGFDEFDVSFGVPDQKHAWTTQFDRQDTPAQNAIGEQSWQRGCRLAQDDVPPRSLPGTRSSSKSRARQAVL